MLITCAAYQDGKKLGDIEIDFFDSNGPGGFKVSRIGILLNFNILGS
jgi:hypothetical protein